MPKAPPYTPYLRKAVTSTCSPSPEINVLPTLTPLPRLNVNIRKLKSE